MPIRPPTHRPIGYSPSTRWQHPAGMESRASRGYGPQWDKQRAIVLREEPWCRYCLAVGRRTPSTTVDHMLPKDRGGTDARSNLCGCCADHQAAKASREGVEARQRGRGSQPLG